jgi:hypothetical protein
MHDPAFGGRRLYAACGHPGFRYEPIDRRNCGGGKLDDALTVLDATILCLPVKACNTDGTFHGLLLRV